MVRKRKPKPVLIIDSREQEPWDFDDDEAFEGTEVGGLKTGDYSVKGMEDIVTVERKATADELFSNFCNKTNAEREFRKIERMRSYPLAYFVIEQDIDQVRSPSSYYVVKKKRNPPHVPPAVVMKALTRIMVDFNIPVIFGGSHARKLTKYILLRAYEMHLKGKLDVNSIRDSKTPG